MKDFLRSVGGFIGLNLFLLLIVLTACAVLVFGMWLMDVLDIHGTARAVLGTVLAFASIAAAYFVGSWSHAWLEKRL